MNGFVPKCGECCFLQNEDINGIGYCKLRCDSMRCGDQCELDHNRIGHDAVIYGLPLFAEVAQKQLRQTENADALRCGETDRCGYTKT